MNVKQELKKSHVIILHVPSNKYGKIILDVSRQLTPAFHVRYVTLNKTRESVLESFKANKVATNRVCFIDGITNYTVGKKQDTGKCYFIDKPNDLGGLTQIIVNDKLNVVLFDSLSTLLIYESVSNVTKFVINLIKKIKNKKIVFIVLKGEKEKALVDGLSKSARIIELK